MGKTAHAGQRAPGAQRARRQRAADIAGCASSEACRTTGDRGASHPARPAGAARSTVARGATAVTCSTAASRGDGSTAASHDIGPAPAVRTAGTGGSVVTATGVDDQECARSHAEPEGFEQMVHVLQLGDLDASALVGQWSDPNVERRLRS